MKSLFKKLSYLGAKPGMPESLVDKYMLTNRSVLVLFLGNLQYLQMGMTDYPSMLLPAVLAVVSHILTLVFNSFSQLNTGRFILTFYAPLGSAIIHLGLLQPGEEPFFSISLTSFCLLLMPWILYNFKQKPRIALSSVWIFLCFLAPFMIEGWNVEAVDTTQFQQGANVYMSFVIAFAALTFCMYLIQRIHQKDSEKNHLLLEEVEKKNEEAEKKSQQLNQVIEEIKENQEKDRQRQWITENLNAITQIIRSEDSAGQMYDQLIAQTVKALKANQGALYILEEEASRQLLNMKACYAYDRKKHLEQKIEIGQGLVGQCYLEKDIIYLTEIPQNYVTITSGLGEATPNALIIVPLIYNDEVVGIIELASFSKFNDFEIEFLQTMGASLANFIINIRMNEMTKRLLAESQTQAEQLQANEEELRQNMEEMNATQEEMQREINRYKQLMDEHGIAEMV